MDPLAPQVHFGPSQAPSPRVSQYPAPYSPVQAGVAQTGITEMLNAIMPIIMIVLLMGMLTPMLKGLGGAK